MPQGALIMLVLRVLRKSRCMDTHCTTNSAPLGFRPGCEEGSLYPLYSECYGRVGISRVGHLGTKRRVRFYTLTDAASSTSSGNCDYRHVTVAIQAIIRTA